MTRHLLEYIRWSAGIAALVIGTLVLFMPGPALAAPSDAGSLTDVGYVPDCNDPDSPLPTWICPDVPPSLLPPGYPYYVGHDEPRMKFLSTRPGSGNNLQ